jgi:hypothetical protein
LSSARKIQTETVPIRHSPWRIEADSVRRGFLQGGHRGRLDDRALISPKDAKHWRDRAAAMRALAADMNTVDASAMMLKLADAYDKLGDRAEVRAKRKQPKEK